MANKADLNRVFVFQQLSIPHLIDTFASLRLVERPLSMTAIDIKEGLAAEFHDAWIPPTSSVIQVLQEAENQGLLERIGKKLEPNQLNNGSALVAYKITDIGRQDFLENLLKAITYYERAVQCLDIAISLLFCDPPESFKSVPPTRSQPINTPFFLDFAILTTIDKIKCSNIGELANFLQNQFDSTYEFDLKAVSVRATVLAAKRLLDITQGLSITPAGLEHIQHLRSAESGIYSRIYAIQQALSSICDELKAYLRKKPKGHLRLIR